MILALWIFHMVDLSFLCVIWGWNELNDGWLDLFGFFTWLIWAELSSLWLIWAELNSMVADLKRFFFFFFWVELGWIELSDDWFELFGFFTWLIRAELNFLWLIWVELSSVVRDLISLDLLHGWFGVNWTLCG